MEQLTLKAEMTVLTEMMKSKFYATAIPVSDVETFKSKLVQIKKDNPKAKHVVYAYRIGNSSKSCDDGEPKGTGGRPILEFLTKKNLSNVAIIVVRYFGGVQLGASRLLRTYLNSAINVVNQCEVINY